MAKFNKAFIPLGISGAFVAFGLVGSLAVNAAYNVMYVPEEIVIEDAGGEDVVAENPENLSTELKKVKIYNGDYYAGLKGKESDPEPAEGYYNSIALTCEGGTDTLQRKLVVTQNQAGAFYQYNGYQVSGGIKNTQDALIGFSRHGMFLKFNEYSLSAEDPEKEISEIEKIVEQSIMKNRGKWYEVAVNKELPSAEDPTDVDAMMESTAIMQTQNYANAWYDSFKESLNGNKGVIDRLINILETTEFNTPDEGSGYYTGEYLGAQVSLSLSNSSKPKFTISGGGETEEITIEHINNTKVRIVESGAGDFYDMVGKGLFDYYKSEYDKYMAEGGGM